MTLIIIYLFNHILLIELATIFNFQLNNLWKKFKTNYNFLLNKQYSKYDNVVNQTIENIKKLTKL